ncbi:Tripartite DNA replication factor [Chytriomyces hyalinus]|nr:Tripartite DNA replication factor [Chytriomyces hyalinus]
MKHLAKKKKEQAAKGSLSIRSYFGPPSESKLASNSADPTLLIPPISSVSSLRGSSSSARHDACEKSQIPPVTSRSALAPPKSSASSNKELDCQTSPKRVSKPNRPSFSSSSPGPSTPSEGVVIWKTSPPLEKLKSFNAPSAKNDPLQEIRRLSNLVGKVDDEFAAEVSSDDKIAQMWKGTSSNSRPTFVQKSNEVLLKETETNSQPKRSKSPGFLSTATPLHKRAASQKQMKRSHSSFTLSETVSPNTLERCQRVRRVKHWASSSCSNDLSLRSNENLQMSSALKDLVGRFQSLDDAARARSLSDEHEPSATLPTSSPHTTNMLIKTPKTATPTAPSRFESLKSTPMSRPFSRSISAADVSTSNAGRTVYLMNPMHDFENNAFLDRRSMLGTPSKNPPLSQNAGSQPKLDTADTVRPYNHVQFRTGAEVLIPKPVIEKDPFDFDDENDDDAFACSMALDAAMKKAEDQHYIELTQGVGVQESCADKCSGRRASTDNVPEVNIACIKSGSKTELEQKDEFDDFDLGDWDSAALDVAMNFIQDSASADSLDTSLFKKREVLRLFDEKTNSEVTVKLREDWCQTEVSTGNYVHIITDSHSSTYIIDNESGFIIVHPDTLVSATYVADTFQCLRRSVFQDLCRVTNDSSPALVYGKILHEVFQTCLLRKSDGFSDSMLEKVIGTQVHACLEDLWAIGETEESAKLHMMEMVPSIKDWGRKYYGKLINSSGTISVARSDTREKTTACVSKVLDIEEHIWSPTWGIKGNIDASLEVKIQTGNLRSSTAIMPFEIKTGKSTTALNHRAQASLYTLMMQDRYDIDVSGSMLYYMKTGEMIHIPFNRNEARGLIINRNRLAQSVTTRTLPGMLQNSNACTRCYSLNTCLVYHKAVEGGDAETSGLGSLFNSNTGHLSGVHTQFFKKWEALLTKEEGDIQTLRKEVWTLTSKDREKYGSCLSDMKVVSDDGYTEDANRVNRFTYTLKKAFPVHRPGVLAQDGTTSEHSFLKMHLGVGDPIVISSEQGHYAFAIGFLTSATEDTIVVTVDRRLKGIPKRLPGFNEFSNQVFNGIEMDASGAVTVQDVSPSELGQTLYRVDKDEFSAGMSLVRGNLINLFLPQTGDERRRRQIVDLVPPQFESLGVGAGVFNFETNADLNEDQKRAVFKVLSAKDYALILGMPGTGKTTTIAQIVKSLVARQKSVLLTAYTHSALDNILLKLKSEGIDFARLGGQQRVHNDIKDYTPKGFDNVEQVKLFYEGKQIVATTCLGIKHAIFSKRKFDYCIVDEASQLTLRKSSSLKFIPFEPQSLPDAVSPPKLFVWVKNAEARDNGLSVSLFRRLSEAHPDSVVTLEHQYRMNTDIMLLSNTLVYRHRLKCGSAEIADSSLHIPNFQQGVLLSHVSAASSDHHSTPNQCPRSTCWIEDLMDPSRRVAFVDTDVVPAPETPGKLGQNPVEARLIVQLTLALLASGVDERDIGIVSPYRAQLRLLDEQLSAFKDLERSTVDKYQGRDKKCIIVSLVRSNAKGNVGELLRDWRRLNVAFTRAKQKLIIFGSRSTLSGTLAFSDFLGIMNEQQWVSELPKNAHLFHCSIEDSVGAATPVLASQERRQTKVHRPNLHIRKTVLALDVMNSILE